MKISSMHTSLVKNIIKDEGVLTVRKYMGLFCVSRPVALKRMKNIAQKTNLRIFVGDREGNPTRLIE